ncbi:MAG: GGDEF domain-containing protein [Clostridiaceae bacterium]|nr:GGDEF domain-containing protein [Clostridiaceae bacterium]
MDIDLEIELARIIESKEITTVFQPIVNLNNAEIIGYEALSRGPLDSPLYLPDKLFKAADNFNKSWELESLCRTKAIEKSSNLSKDKYLFLNVDPQIFKDEKFKKGFTKEFLACHNMSPDSIIFEITEKTAIEDYNSFKIALNNYVNQGYKIAIDDTGAGYSGLKTLAETKPHYIKIDMDLVRNIDTDTFKQAIMKTFVSLSNATNMKLIAEGIETKEELITLINLGVYAGQGFFLLRPAGTFLDLPEEIKCLVTNLNMPTSRKNYDFQTHIGAITLNDIPFPSSTLSKDLGNFFHEKSVTGVCIVDNARPVGLVMKYCLDSVLATQYGIAVFSKRPISLVMDTSPLIVDYYTPVFEVSKFAMERADEQIYDYVIVTKNSKYHGVVTIKSLLQHTTMLERNYARELNPLTGLPGNSIIENTISDIIDYNYEICLLYLDLDNFKVYNDTYGFENGDKILKYSANLIQNKVKSEFPFNSFVGHIGGDDFVCMLKTSYEQCKIFCSEIIGDFNKEVLEFFNEEDKSNGYIESMDRKGNTDIFNLTSISIAGLYGNLKNFKSPEEVAQTISRIKKDVKDKGGNNFIIISLK